MALPTGFSLEEKTQGQTTTLPQGFTIEPSTNTNLPQGFNLEQDKPNIFERAGEKFQRVSSTITNRIGELANEPSDQLTIPGDIVRAGQGVGDFLERAKPLADPNVSFPFLTPGRAGDIGFQDIVAPITSQVASSAGRSFKEGGFKGISLGLAKGAILPEAALADFVGTGMGFIIDVIGNVADVGDAEFRKRVLGKDPGRKFEIRHW